MKPGISIVLLAYNEADNLRVLIPRIKVELAKIEEDYDILVIDTATPTDDTADVCAAEGCRYIPQEWDGFGGALRTGIKYAERDKFLILDSDGSHDPVYICSIYQRFIQGDVDLVIGSRYVKGGVTSDSFTSILMSRILNLVFRIFLGIRARDISTNFRMYRTAYLKEVELTERNYNVLQEVLVKIRLNHKDFRIAEVPIHFHKRIYGESKRRLLPFIISYAKSLCTLTWMRLRGNH